MAVIEAALSPKDDVQRLLTTLLDVVSWDEFNDSAVMIIGLVRSTR